MLKHMHTSDVWPHLLICLLWDGLDKCVNLQILYMPSHLDKVKETQPGFLQDTFLNNLRLKWTHSGLKVNIIFLCLYLHAYKNSTNLYATVDGLY